MNDNFTANSVKNTEIHWNRSVEVFGWEKLPLDYFSDFQWKSVVRKLSSVIFQWFPVKIHKRQFHRQLSEKYWNSLKPQCWSLRVRNTPPRLFQWFLVKISNNYSARVKLLTANYSTPFSVNSTKICQVSVKTSEKFSENFSKRQWNHQWNHCTSPRGRISFQTILIICFQ